MLKKRLLKSIIMRHAGDSSFKYTGKRKILLFGHSRFRKHKGNCYCFKLSFVQFKLCATRITAACRNVILHCYYRYVGWYLLNGCIIGKIVKT